MEEIVGVHLVVHGKVQGVGFRAFTEFQANYLQLHGWVRNCQDGTVEVEGQREALETFLNILEKGPRFSQVPKIMVDWKDANRQTYGFTVRRD